MMTITSAVDFSKFSNIAVASYAWFDEAAPSEALRDKANMTETQASNFLDGYEVIHHQPNDLSGFSATVFKEKATGKIFFAIRGTEIPAGLVSDLVVSDIFQIGPEGYAKSQATSLYRYWKKLTTAGGESVAYSESEVMQLYAVSKGLTDLASIDFGIIDYLDFRNSLLEDKGVHVGQGEGAPLISPEEKVNVAGHSLGGHLAMLFARFFPANVNEVVTLNAPGFFWGSDLLTTLGFPPPNDNNITRLEADGDGISKLGTIWPGTAVVIAQESEQGAISAITANHSSVNGNDALALMRVIAKLDPLAGSDVAALSNLFRAVSNVSGSSYEKLLDAFRKLIAGADIYPTPVTTGTDPVARELFYQHLNTLQQDARYKQA